MSAARAVLFDLDGTLLDTLDDIADAANASLDRLGLPTHPVTFYTTAVGDGVAKLMERSLPADRGAQYLEQSISGMKKVYAEHWSRKTRPYPGITDMLQRLTRDGLPLAVLSNKPHPFTVNMVNYYFPDIPFHTVLGAENGFPRKPDPSAALHIAANMQVAPPHVAYLGDTDTDMQTAVAAGMQALGVSWGFRTAAELKAHGALCLLDTPADLFRWINETGN